MPRSNSRSSTFLSDRGYFTYIITTSRITSGELLKQRNGLAIGTAYNRPVKRLRLAADLADRTGGRSELRARARATIDGLRANTGESVLLAVVDNDQLIAIDILESMHLLRTVPRIGGILPPRESAAGQAVLAYMLVDRQARILGGEPDKALLARLAAARKRGFALNQGAIEPGSIAVAAPILDVDGQPVAAISVSGPAERMKADVQARIGIAVVDAARRLSLSEPALAA